jgi:hypothetical protein
MIILSSRYRTAVPQNREATVECLFYSTSTISFQNSDASHLVLSQAHFFFVNIGGCMLGCLLLHLLKETEHDFKALVICASKDSHISWLVWRSGGAVDV